MGQYVNILWVGGDVKVIVLCEVDQIMIVLYYGVEQFVVCFVYFIDFLVGVVVEYYQMFFVLVSGIY